MLSFLCSTLYRDLDTDRGSSFVVTRYESKVNSEAGDKTDPSSRDPLTSFFVVFIFLLSCQFVAFIDESP